MNGISQMISEKNWNKSYILTVWYIFLWYEKQFHGIHCGDHKQPLVTELGIPVM